MYVFGLDVHALYFFEFFVLNFEFTYICCPGRFTCRGNNAGVVKLVDTLDLGSSAARLGGSSPSTRTQLLIKQLHLVVTAFLFL
jgi:hypothetical protein